MAAEPTTNPSKLPHLPTEVLLDVFTAGLTHPDACALSLLCPDWALCSHNHANTTPPTPNQTKLLALQALLRTTRVDTYTLPAEGEAHGKVTTSFDHASNPNTEHLWLPQMDDPRSQPDVPTEWIRAELTRRWVSGSGTVVVSLPRLVSHYMLSPQRKEERLLPYEEDTVTVDTQQGKVTRVTGRDGWEKEGPVGEVEEGGELRYWYQRLRGLVVTREWLRGDGAVPQGWRTVEGRDVLANLKVRWEEMGRLEVLCLDLRRGGGPEPEYMRNLELARLAQSLKGRGLALLVIAGLRSDASYPGGEASGVAEVEDGRWDARRRVWRKGSDERGDDINWWKTFGEAVRPGGRLVFVDKRDGGELSLLQPDARHTTTTMLFGL